MKKKRIVIFDKYSLLKILFPIITLSFFREPLFFIYPRIWAEDGTIYLNSALKSSFWNIFNPNNTGYSDINYYSFFPNFISYISANIFPISYAAHINTYSAVIFQVLTCIVIYIGRNGMHKYNNQDHSILTGFRAAELIFNDKVSKKDKKLLWEINAEKEYHESKINN